MRTIFSDAPHAGAILQSGTIRDRRKYFRDGLLVLFECFINCEAYANSPQRQLLGTPKEGSNITKFRIRLTEIYELEVVKTFEHSDDFF